MKYLLIIIFIFFPPIVFAGNDIIITCSESSQCTKSSELPLFNESNLYPGFKHTQKLSIKNLKNEKCNLNFYILNNPISADKFNLIINNNSTVLYSNTLNNILTNNSLGSINPHSQNDYDFTIIFDHNSTNNSQNTNTIFNLDFNFNCEDNTSNILGASTTNINKKLLVILSISILIINLIFSRYFHKKTR